MGSAPQKTPLHKPNALMKPLSEGRDAAYLYLRFLAHDHAAANQQ